ELAAHQLGIVDQEEDAALEPQPRRPLADVELQEVGAHEPSRKRVRSRVILARSAVCCKRMAIAQRQARGAHHRPRSRPRQGVTPPHGGGVRATGRTGLTPGARLLCGSVVGGEGAGNPRIEVPTPRRLNDTLTGRAPWPRPSPPPPTPPPAPLPERPRAERRRVASYRSTRSAASRSPGCCS